MGGGEQVVLYLLFDFLKNRKKFKLLGCLLPQTDPLGFQISKSILTCVSLSLSSSCRHGYYVPCLQFTCNYPLNTSICPYKRVCQHFSNCWIFTSHFLFSFYFLTRGLLQFCLNHINLFRMIF